MTIFQQMISNKNDGMGSHEKFTTISCEEDKPLKFSFSFPFIFS